MFLLVLLCAACDGTQVDNKAKGQGGGDGGNGAASLRVLFVGNSYTYQNDLPGTVASLSLSVGSATHIRTDSIAYGGYTWGQHVYDATTTARIAEGWDVVVLQDQSMQPVFEHYRLKADAQTLNQRIQAAGGRTVLFMTWPRAFHNLQEQHYFPLYYNHHGAYLNATVAPVGSAWTRALFDRPALRLHAGDDSHPNPTGTYLAACVLYATLTGQSPVGLSGANPGLADADRDFLQATAWRAYQASPGPAAPLKATYKLSATALENYLMSAGVSIGDTTGPSGAPGGATAFDGTDVVSVPYHPRQNPVRDFTAAVFVRRNDWSTPPAGTEWIVHKADGYGLYQSGANLIAYVTTANSGSVTTAYDVTGLTAGWHHIAVTYDGAVITLYVDGGAVATAAATGVLDYGPFEQDDYYPLTLGAKTTTFPGPNTAALGFIGALADFRLYHHVLTAQEINGLSAGM